MLSKEALEKLNDCSYNNMKMACWIYYWNKPFSSAVFLFKHANSKQFEEGKQGEEEKERIIADGRLAMLMSWLPLLCQASNGTDSPVLSSREKEEMVRVLEELIEKLSWEQQEEVLALWLHHFASFPDSDWPNLEASYTRWYAEARKLLLKYSP